MLRLLAGWCGLLLYVGAFSPLGMGVTALLGTIDPDHHARFQPGSGGMRLVLHHEGNCSGHQHGVVARALTIFAQPVSNTDPDHVLQFISLNGFTRDSQLIVPAANPSEPVIVYFAESAFILPAGSIQFIPAARPPPDAVCDFLYLRTTVLLI